LFITLDDYNHPAPIEHRAHTSSPHLTTRTYLRYSIHQGLTGYIISTPHTLGLPSTPHPLFYSTVITATMVGRRFTEKELKASRAEKARAQIAMPQHKSSSTKVTKPGAPQEGSNFQEMLRRAKEVEALLAAEKATKEVEKVARRQREE
jgi:hypothetical protein